MTTLKDKMFEIIDGVSDEYLSLRKTSDAANRCAEIAEQEKIAFAIEIIEKEQARLLAQNKELASLFTPMEDFRLKGKIEGTKLAYENLRQTLNSLKNETNN